jgi:hypothetical protein
MTGPSIDNARNDFAESKRWWKRLLALQFVGLLVNVLSGALGSWPTVSWTLSVTALAIAAGLFFSRARADEAYERGELIRRGSFLRDGLGQPMAVDEAVRLSVESTTIESTDPPIEGKYYASNLPPGPRRLAHILFESAMATELSAKRAAAYSIAVVISGAAVMLFALVLIALAAEPGVPTGLRAVQRNAVSIASACTTALSFFVLGTFVEIARAFWALADRCRGINARLPTLIATRGTELVDVLPSIDGYHFALARCPPLPSFVWSSVQQRFNTKWAEAQHLLLAQAPDA